MFTGINLRIKARAPIPCLDVFKVALLMVFVGAETDQSNAIYLNDTATPESYTEGRNFGHIAYEVENIYETCQRLMDSGVIINRPPREGYMAFVRSPDGISIELLQKGKALAPQEPWASMENTGHW